MSIQVCLMRQALEIAAKNKINASDKVGVEVYVENGSAYITPASDWSSRIYVTGMEWIEFVVGETYYIEYWYDYVGYEQWELMCEAVYGDSADPSTATVEHISLYDTSKWGEGSIVIAPDLFYLGIYQQEV